MSGDRPLIGDVVEMAFMDGDARTEVVFVNDAQPLFETDGIFIIADQYGDEHLIELDGENWVTVNSDALSSDGFDRWLEHIQMRTNGHSVSL